jgi:hypothetical protein
MHCIAWHGMAYYIFLKSLRSLEEFRKILMSKFLLNILVQISKALVNSNNLIFNSEILFFAFGPADLVAHSAVGPAGPAEISPLPQAKAHRLAQAAQPTRVVGVIAEVRFLH